jgi:hypothetical protein
MAKKFIENGRIEKDEDSGDGTETAILEDKSKRKRDTAIEIRVSIRVGGKRNTKREKK